jgi:hypothetical protein
VLDSKNSTVRPRAQSALPVRSAVDANATLAVAAKLTEVSKLPLKGPSVSSLAKNFESRENPANAIAKKGVFAPAKTSTSVGAGQLHVVKPFNA